MANNWERIKEMISMRDLAEEFGLLYKKDRGIKCPVCGYENKTQPPVYYGDDYFYCHKCHESGNIFRLYSLIRGGNDTLAMINLSRKVGLEYRVDDKLKLFISRSKSYDKFAKKYAELPPEIKKILNERGLKDDFIEKKRIGWVPLEAKNEN